MERRVPGIEGPPACWRRAGRGSEVVVVGQSLQDRDDTLDSLVRSFALGGPIAVLLASVLGYALAAAGLRPVEAMRRRAREVSLSRADERLPLPAARDEIRRLGETLNEMLDRLSRSFERERRFVADASHELRTPGGGHQDGAGGSAARGRPRSRRCARRWSRRSRSATTSRSWPRTS